MGWATVAAHWAPRPGASPGNIKRTPLIVILALRLCKDLFVMIPQMCSRGGVRGGLAAGRVHRTRLSTEVCVFANLVHVWLGPLCYSRRLLETVGLSMVVCP